MRPNRLRQLLDNGEPTLGTRIITPWPGIVEIIGQTGAFDYIEYVGEYSSYDPQLLDNMGRAVELFPKLSAMFKVEEQGRGFITPRAVDSGFQSILFADCRDAAQVADCIALVRPETPEARGNHGAAMRRSVGYVSYSGSPQWVEAMNQIVIGIMIEKARAMENLDEIMAVPGIDFLQFGPVDYSISVGRVGEARSDEIKSVQRDMIARALEAGVHPRVEVNSFEQTKPFLDLGVRHFCIGFDVVVLASWCHEQKKGMRELLQSSRSIVDDRMPERE